MWMFAGGLLATVVAVSEMQKQQWAYLIFEAKLCVILILLSGVLLLAASTTCFWIVKYRPAAYVAGAAGGGLFALTIFVGMLSGAIPCSGPS